MVLFVVCVVEMLDEIVVGYGWMLVLEWDWWVYFVFVVMLFDVVCELLDVVDYVLLVGYNFGFEDLVLMMVFDGVDVLCEVVEDKYLIVSLVEMMFDIVVWFEVVSGGVVFMCFVWLWDFDLMLGLDVD